MQVSSSERGLVRLFAVDLPPEDMARFREANASGWPLLEALGATTLDMDHVELFDVADLEELGLTGYMREGLGITETQVAEDAARLSNLKGWVLMVRSSAFDRVAQTLAPKPPLHWIGTYAEEGMNVQFAPLPDASAKGTGAPIEMPPVERPRSPYLTVLLALLALPVVALILGAIFWGLS